MNIVLIVPAFTKDIPYDIYPLYKSLEKDHSCKIKIITCNKALLKSRKEYANFELDDSIEIFRFPDILEFPRSYINNDSFFKKVLVCLGDFIPDIVLCSQTSNLRLSKKLSNYYDSPLILITEFLFNTKNPERALTGRYVRFFKKFHSKFINLFVGLLYWMWISHTSNSIISSDNASKADIDFLDRFDKDLHSYSWPSYNRNNYSRMSKKEDRLVFIGAFSKHKNVKEFEYTIPNIIDRTHINDVIIVGNGDDRIIIDNLVSKYPDNIRHIESLPTKDALNLIASSYIAYTPSKNGGWAFIIDSWIAKTPLVSTNNHFNFRDNFDSIIARKENIHTKINDLHSNPNLYEEIRTNGYSRYQQHHDAKMLSSKYYSVMSKFV